MTWRTPSPRTAQLREVVRELGRADVRATDADRIDQLRALEEVKAAAAAAQVRLAVELTASQEQQQRDAGVSEDEVGLGIGAQVALAKRESHVRGRRFVGFARVLHHEMPCTYAQLVSGRTTELRAQIVVKETVWLSLEDRQAVDAEVAPHLHAWGDRRVEAEVRKRAYRLDPRGFVERAATAAEDRRVTVRPAPDVMSNLNAHLPVGQGIAAYAALRRDADSKRAAGDERSIGQIMADTLVERVTGQATAEAVPVAISLVMTDQTLLGTRDGGEEPAHVGGYGPVPGGLARRLLLAADSEADAWVQRLYTHPATGQLAAIDSTSRTFRGALRKLLVTREQWCRTPWCGAPIRHGDHAIDHADDGETSVLNGQGLCEACNYAKTAPGWTAAADGDGGTHTVTTTSPTGHRYRSRPPHPPGYRRTPPADPRIDLTVLERHFAEIVAAA